MVTSRELSADSRKSCGGVAKRLRRLTAPGTHRCHPVKRHSENGNVSVNFRGIEDTRGLAELAMPMWGSEAEALAAFIECLLRSKLSLRPLEQ